MAEYDMIPADHTGQYSVTHREFLGFKPENIKRVPSLAPINHLFIFTLYFCA